MQTRSWFTFDRARMAAALAVMMLMASPAAAQKKGGAIDTPAISCTGATQTSIDIQVCAGATTGAPAGFSLQWLTAEELAAGADGIPGTADDNQWFASADLQLCKASFSGNANLSRYNLTAGECVNVNVGEFLFDNGASTNCPDGLACGTEYVFRAFAHATSTLVRSNFTPILTGCSTLPCDEGDEGGCTLTQGYWKTHGPVPTGNNEYTWPDDVKAAGLFLGSNSYTPGQLLNILDTPASGNGLIALAHQLIAAKLNIAAGADPTDAAAAIASADTLIGGLIIPPIGAGYLAPAATSALITALTNYNEGATGPGHCN